MTSQPEQQTQMNLANLAPGAYARILSIQGHSPFRKRLLEMGLVRGEIIHKLKIAPLRDPAEYVVKNYHVSLRRTEAADVLIQPLDPNDPEITP